MILTVLLVGLAEVIRRGVERNPAYVRLLGGNIKLKKMWLDIIYPPRPPARHFISGYAVRIFPCPSRANPVPVLWSMMTASTGATDL